MQSPLDGYKYRQMWVLKRRHPDTFAGGYLKNALRYFLLIVGVSTLNQIAVSQIVSPFTISNSGDSYTSGDIGFTYSVGQVTIGMFSNGNLMFSAGFQQPIIGLDVLPMTDDCITVTHATCTTPTGAVSLNMCGGLQPFHYKWSTGDSTSFVEGLEPGEYSATVTDYNGDSIVISSVIGYETEWDTMVKIGFNGEGKLVPINPSGTFDNRAFGLNSLNPGTDGWVQFSIAEGDTFYGVMGLASNPYWDETAHPIGIIINGSTNLIILRCDSINGGYNFGAYLPGVKYNFRIALEGDTLVFTKQWENGGIFAADYKIKCPILSSVSPGILGLAANSKLSSVITSFDCSQIRLEADIQLPSSFYDTGTVTVFPKGGSSPYWFKWSTGDTLSSVNLPVGQYSLTVTDNNLDSIVQGFFLGAVPHWKILNNATKYFNGLRDSLWNPAAESSFAYGDNFIPVDSNGTLSFDFAKAGDFYGFMGLASSVDVESSTVQAFGLGLLPTEQESGSPGLFLVSNDFEPIFLGYVRDSIPLNLKIKKEGDVVRLIKNDLADYLFPLDTAMGLYPIVIGLANDFSISSITCDFNSQLSFTPNIVHNKCDTFLTSFVTTEVHGGKPPYQYYWSTTDTTSALSSLPAGDYNLMVIDALLDTVQSIVAVGHRISWETLFNCTADSNGLVTFDVPDSSNGVAFAQNTLSAGSDGWVDFTFEKYAFVKGAFGLLDNLVEDDGMNLLFIEIDSTGEVYLHESLEAREIYFGSCDLAATYKFSFRFEEDTVHILKRNLMIGEDVGEISAYFPRTFTLSPFISCKVDSAEFLQVHSSFACSATPCPQPPNPGAVLVTSDTVCLGDGVFLSVDSSGFNTEWFINSCGTGQLIGSSSEIFFRSDTSVTIFVRNRNYCLLTADSSVYYDHISDSCYSIRLIVQDSSTCVTRNFALLQFEDQENEGSLAVTASFKFSVTDYSYLAEDSIGLKYRILDLDTSAEVVSARDVKYSSDGYYLIDGLSVLSLGTTYQLEFILNNGNRYSYYVIRN